jgi:large subunit ribosomal protein L10
MSKVIKAMEMEALRTTFKGVRDLVLLSPNKLNSLGESTFRTSLRKKNIRVQVVKNTLARKVFRELELNIADDSPYWSQATMVAWGAGSVAELSRAVESELKDAKKTPLYKDKVSIKGAVADGQAVTFDQATKMPTRAEAIARVITLALSPGRRVMAQVIGPASMLAAQIKSIKDKEGAEAPAAP